MIFPSPVTSHNVFDVLQYVCACASLCNGKNRVMGKKLSKNIENTIVHGCIQKQEKRLTGIFSSSSSFW